MTSRQAAFTLTEVMISMVILISLLTCLLSSMTTVMDYTNLGSAQDDLAIESKRLSRQIEEDLCLSGWYSPPGKGYQTTSAKDRTDSGSRYYPYVQVQDYSRSTTVSGLGSQFPLHKRPNSLVALGHWGTPSGPEDSRHKYDALPGSRADSTSVFCDGTNVSEYGVKMKAFYASYYAKSQEIIFVRSNIGTPGLNDYAILFPKDNPDAWRLGVDGKTVTGLAPQNALGILSMSEYQRAERAMESATDKSTFGYVNNSKTNEKTYYRIKGPDGKLKVFDPELPTAWLDWNSGDFTVNLRWETVEPIDASATTNPAGSTTTDKAYTNVDRTDGVVPAAYILSEYSYIVVPSSVGVGRLVRCVKKKLSAPPTLVTKNPALGDAIGSSTDPDDKASTPTTYYLVVDKILSDNVARVVFDTIRTNPMVGVGDAVKYGSAGADWIKQQALDVNQIRYRLYLVRQFRVNNRDVVIYQTVEGLTNMRAKSTAVDMDLDRKAHVAVPSTPLIR